LDARNTAGARLCPQDQPQQLRISSGVGLNSTLWSVPTALRLMLRTQPRSIHSRDRIEPEGAGQKVRDTANRYLVGRSDFSVCFRALTSPP